MQDELGMLIDKYQSAQERLSDAKHALDDAKAEFKVIEEALTDYMTGNGLVEDSTSTKIARIKKGATVVVDDVDALPEEYVRVKREADRALIRKNRPQANWWREEETIKLEVKNLC